ncbi:ArsA family ATPase [Nocardiopsis sp. MG754419]|uniref:ArsA family ATPase n=1 Tax=Nocardiopsis sp. MG754419 TaxID=2259865 RepID=UPI001BA4FC14|nr:ArsA family ATPase [Nocardiopsis sp. MG754419]MBR8741983.1 ArsA family ATPase [Nocardiopsis sp. MG754419]
MDVDALLDDPKTRIVVCCGAGGVGKTTTAAALGLRAAERGRRAVVITVDPARRLAQSLGLVELDNTPRPVPLPRPALAGGDGGDPDSGRPDVEGRGPGDRDAEDPDGEDARVGPGEDAATVGGSGGDTDDPDGVPGDGAHGGDDRAGSLHAMMLDMKRTFDEVVRRHADPERARQILANPFYQTLSTSFSGTQEYMAMEKLGQLRESGDWDLIVVDTPPSRSALDFLDAPKRLGRFLDGKLIRFLSPAGSGAFRLLGAGMNVVGSVVGKIVGTQFLNDLRSFVAAFDTVFGGFQERAERTYRLLRAPGTAFVVVAVPDTDAMREAAFFVERLDRDSMPLAGLVVNRTHPLPTGPGAELDAERATAAAVSLADSHPLAVAALRLHAERVRTRERERLLCDRMSSAHPKVRVTEVAARAEDVHDLAGLREIGSALAGEER